MKKSLALFLALSGSAAMAAFTAPADVASRPDAPVASAFTVGQNAAIQMVFSAENGDSEECSGTMISSDGYAITALHCLELCSSSLVRHGADGGDYFETNVDKVRRGDECKVKVAFNNRSVYSSSARIVAAGRGFIARGSAQSSVGLKAAAAQGIGPMGDFAIVKLSKNPAAGCISAESNVTAGEAVWNMAYPTRTSRDYGENDFNAPGKKVMFSSGHLQSLGPVLSSTIDIVPSSSGSGLFTYAGKLIAVSNSILVAHGTGRTGGILKQELPGSAHSVSIAHVMSEVSALYGEDVVKSAFSCY
jgi:hypothetical protein